MIAGGKVASPRAEMLCKLFLYGIFVVFMLLWHIPLPFCGDDAYLLPLVGERSIAKHFGVLYRTNGKIFTDFLAFLFYHLPYPVWKLFNTGIFLVVAVLLVRLFTKNTPQDVLSVCALVACFPLSYLGTAGYIATCANYLYPLAGLLFIALQLKRICRGKASPLMLLTCVPVTAYVLNQDQAACILLGGLLCLLGFIWFEMPDNRHLEGWISGYFLFCLVSYVILFALPGHINRMRSPLEMEMYLPEYADWSLLDKVYHGFTATVANLFFRNSKLTFLFFFLLFLVCQRKSPLWLKLVSGLPLVIFVILIPVNDSVFLIYRSEMPELKELTTLGGIAGLVISCVCLACMVITVCRRLRRQTRWFLLGILLLGGGSRLMMGFSATLYASQYRTFTYLLFCLIGGCLILLRELDETHQKSLRQTGIASILLALLLK